MKNFNEKSFTLFTINYIVGFGFISTIVSLVNLNLFGIITVVATTLITFGVSLVFSRLTNNFKNEYGGSYNYTKKLNNKNFSFFVGWNQYIQGPILASTSPLFLATAAGYLTNDSNLIWIIRAVSIGFFILLVLISTMGLKLNKYVILASGTVKWLILLVAFIIVIYLTIKNFNQPSVVSNSNITAYLIFSNILTFMYSFGGIEDVSAMANDVKFKNFRKIIMIAFAFILTFYFVFYIIFVFAGSKIVIDGKPIENFSQIFQIALGATGIWVFIIGLLFNGISGKISIAISTSRKVVPLAADGYLFHFLTYKNSKGEFKNAIWFSAIITIVSMLIFWLIPTLLDIENFFESVIEIGSVAFLLQYFLTFIVAFILEKKKIIGKIPTWEKIAYVISMSIIFVTLLVFLFPFIAGQNWKTENTIILVSYIIFIGLGYVMKLISGYVINKKNKPMVFIENKNQENETIENNNLSNESSERKILI